MSDAIIENDALEMTAATERLKKRYPEKENFSIAEVLDEME